MDLLTVVAIGSALLGAGLAQLNAVRQKNNEARVAQWKTQLERRADQLNRLYGPAAMLRAKASGLM